MKEFLFVVTPNSNKELVQNAFNQYFNKPNASNLINLANVTLAYAISKTEIKSIELEIGQRMFSGGYLDGKISLSKALFKKAKKTDAIIDVLESLFHELTHAIQEINNLKILQERKKLEHYSPFFGLNQITHILNEMSGDYEFACAGSMYLYKQNQNELVARQNADKMLRAYLNEFAKGQSFAIPSFLEKEQKFQTSLYKDYPSIRWGKKYINVMIIDFQCKIIEKGLNNATEIELKELVASLNVILDDDTKNLLVQACTKCEDIKKVKMLLYNPLIKLTKEQYNALAKTYGQNIINSITFTENVKDSQSQEKA